MSGEARRERTAEWRVVESGGSELGFMRVDRAGRSVSV